MTKLDKHSSNNLDKMLQWTLKLVDKNGMRKGIVIAYQNTDCKEGKKEIKYSGESWYTSQRIKANTTKTRQIRNLCIY